MILVKRKKKTIVLHTTLCAAHESLRPGESKNEGRWTRGVTRGHCIQLYPVYTFRFTRGEVVPSNNLMIHQLKTAQRGWNGRAVVCTFFSTWYPSCIPAAFNDKSRCHSITISIVSAYPVRSENILYPNTSSSRKENCCVYQFRYLWQKQNKKTISTICIADCNAVLIYTVP